MIEARYQSRTTAAENPKVIYFFKSTTVGLDLGGVGPAMSWSWSLMILGAKATVLVESLSGVWFITTLEFDDGGGNHQWASGSMIRVGYKVATLSYTFGRILIVEWYSAWDKAGSGIQAGTVWSVEDVGDGFGVSSSQGGQGQETETVSMCSLGLTELQKRDSLGYYKSNSC